MSAIHAAIAVHRVRFSYDEFSIDQCTFEVPVGACAMLLGPNGAGKSSVLRLVSGFIKPQSGIIKLFGEEVLRLPATERARRVAFVAQDTAYVFPFSVEEVIFMGRFAHAPGRFFESSQDERVVAWAMDVTDTRRVRTRLMSELSGGERRRVEIARALAQEAPLLLLDEPTTHLDIKQQRDMFCLLQRLNSERCVTVLCVTHHLELARDYGTHFFGMRRGHVHVLDAQEYFSSQRHIEALFNE